MRVAVAAVNQDGDDSGFIKFRQWRCGNWMDAIGTRNVLAFTVNIKVTGYKYSASKSARREFHNCNDHGMPRHVESLTSQTRH